MSEQDQIKHFSDELDKLVDRYASEYDLCYASVVGALMMKVHLLCKQASESEEEA